ncbi:uncharacterized protein SPPG_09483 [Spizellomyces punctatus DAOM BR117]|uniref:Uncharacterized protein n=1 Tax=Spizellomyces punctatus (strain DAOM BR117) TaxID=645134 RepID=A0A0L0H9A1_SPIPD|nr:uncharacterized protein SPPG_09483 [Spizellomyces punctatus DAOM BR117]KNC97238.1 hypothetical protein SPPG_09483 [Spizellomyces punctatus DAOM BR117]|eukprot:XP_016605278.1 hypothetical protein SPPG_09483 [Spizellomyces punctatus DAOM BR117]
MSGRNASEMDEDFEFEADAMRVEENTPAAFVYGTRSSRGHTGSSLDDTTVAPTGKQQKSFDERLVDTKFFNAFPDDFDDTSYV